MDINISEESAATIFRPLFHPEDGSSMFLRNVDTYCLPNYTA
jgi:hypothetical protein